MLTVFMAMGAWRISRARVLTRRAAAIETLGSATVLCTDKTGTLTENRMSVAELRNTERRRSSGPSTCLERACPSRSTTWSSSACSPARRPVRSDGEGVPRTWSTGNSPRPSTCTAPSGPWCRRTAFAPTCSPCRTSGRRPMAGRSSSSRPRARRKRSPSCATWHRRRSPRSRTSVDAMAAEGLRVLGVARASFVGRAWPESQHDFAFEFLGLVGLADPLRPSVPAAVARMPVRRHHGGDDHRRLSGDRHGPSPARRDSTPRTS